jgi:Nuclease-related domain
MARTYGYNTVPGYSALAEARRRLATAPGWEWHVAGALGLTFAAGLLAGRLTPWSLVLLPVLLVVLGAGLTVTTARRRALVASWRQGAKGERQTAKLLAKLEQDGWRVFHDLAIPGSRANVDHLAIGPGGVWIIDSKLWGRQVRWDPRHGWMHGQSAITPELNITRWEVAEVEQALVDSLNAAARHLDPPGGIDVHLAWCVHGEPLPGGKLIVDGETIVNPRHLLSLLRAGRGPKLPPAAVEQIAGTAEIALPRSLPGT